jgi:hypothetical protein
MVCFVDGVLSRRQKMMPTILGTKYDVANDTTKHTPKRVQIFPHWGKGGGEEVD